jgi:histidinol phosphatase-like enzyme
MGESPIANSLNLCFLISYQSHNFQDLLFLSSRIKDIFLFFGVFSKDQLFSGAPIVTELFLLDVDGTIAEKYTRTLLPEVADYFQRFWASPAGRRSKIALVTNQGGVGMRYQLEQRRQRNSSRYPTEAEVLARLNVLTQALSSAAPTPVAIPFYVCFRFLSHSGQWTPAPPERADDPRWSKDWRKPAPGMLLQAMQDAHTLPDQTLMVGDSTDDENAALAAGCPFTWAKDFFAAPIPDPPEAD